MWDPINNPKPYLIHVLSEKPNLMPWFSWWYYCTVHVIHCLLFSGHVTVVWLIYRHNEQGLISGWLWLNDHLFPSSWQILHVPHDENCNIFSLMSLNWHKQLSTSQSLYTIDCSKRSSCCKPTARAVTFINLFNPIPIISKLT